MIKTRRALDVTYPDVRFTLQIHDDLILECKKEYAENVVAIMKKEMEGCVKLSVPLIVNITQSDTL